jgi:hypothetical protein
MIEPLIPGQPDWIVPHNLVSTYQADHAMLFIHYQQQPNTRVFHFMQGVIDCSVGSNGYRVNTSEISENLHRRIMKMNNLGGLFRALYREISL